MIKILLLLTTFTFGASDFTVLLSCDKLPEYAKICDINATPSEEVVEAPIYLMEHNIIWGYGDNNGSAFVGDIEIRYLENEFIHKSTTNTAGQFSLPIIPNEEFHLYAYDTIASIWITHEVKYVLCIGSTTGNLLWKQWKPSTSKWINLDLDVGVSLTPNESNVIDNNVTVIPEESNISDGIVETVTNIIFDMGSFVSD